MWQIHLGIWQCQPLKPFSVSLLLLAADKMFFSAMVKRILNLLQCLFSSPFLPLRNQVTEENKNG